MKVNKLLILEKCKYSYDGKTLRVFNVGDIVDIIESDDAESSGMHRNVAQQFKDQKRLKVIEVEE